MILLGVGANLPSPSTGSPRSTCESALAALPGEGVQIAKLSRWYESAPVPASGQRLLSSSCPMSCWMRPTLGSTVGFDWQVSPP